MSKEVVSTKSPVSLDRAYKLELFSCLWAELKMVFRFKVRLQDIFIIYIELMFQSTLKLVDEVDDVNDMNFIDANSAFGFIYYKVVVVFNNAPTNKSVV